MSQRTRRAALSGGVSVLAAMLAGCSTRSSGDENTSTAEPGSGDDIGQALGATTSGATGETPTGTARSDGLLLPSVDAAGSPGSLVAVRPSGRVALLDFFATWCPPCKPEMKHLRAVREQYDPAQLSIVSVTQETDESAIRSFWEEYDGNWPVATDPTMRAGRRFDVTNIPTILVLTPDGTEVARHTGLVTAATLTDAVDAAIERSDAG